MENLGNEKVLKKVSAAKKLSQDEINKIMNKTPKLIGKVRSIQDKIDDITIREDGTVVHNYLRVSKSNTEYRIQKKRLKRHIK